MLVPQEVLDYIIDEYAEDQSFKEILPLRLVSRAWTHRVNFHAFRKITATIREGLEFLSFIKASKFGIAKYIKFLTILSPLDDFTSRIFGPKGFYPQERGYSSVEDYLNDFVASVPHLYALNLVGLSPISMEYVPHFHGIKQLSFDTTILTAPQLSDLILATSSLESLGNADSWMTRISGGITVTHSENRAVLSEKLANLKHYSVRFPFVPPPGSESFESFLFPVDDAARIPHLRCLVLRAIKSTDISTAAILLRASTQSLQYLYLKFSRQHEVFKSGEFRKTFDLSQYVNLKYIRFEDIEHHAWIYYQSPLECSLIVLESLPKSGRDIILCFSFRSAWEEGQEKSLRLDQIISANSTVKKLDIAVPRPEKDRKSIVSDLPRSFIAGILSVSSRSDLALVKLENILRG